MGKQQMKKTMSQTDVLFLAIGAMLGWGWVVLSGDWISTAGFLGKDDRVYHRRHTRHLNRVNVRGAVFCHP